MMENDEFRRESFIFYRSFYEAIVELPEENQLPIFRAIAELSLNANCVELKGVEKSIFTLIKPQIDANSKRYENGKKGAAFGDKGGRKSKKSEKKETPRTKNENPTHEKNKPQNPSTLTPNVNVNVNVNDNVNVNEVLKEKNAHGIYKHVLLSDEEYNTLKTEHDNHDELINFLDSYMEMRGKKYENCFAAIKLWVVDAVNERKAKSNKSTQFSVPTYETFESKKLSDEDLEQLNEWIKSGGK